MKFNARDSQSSQNFEEGLLASIDDLRGWNKAVSANVFCLRVMRVTKSLLGNLNFAKDSYIGDRNENLLLLATVLIVEKRKGHH